MPEIETITQFLNQFETKNPFDVICEREDRKVESEYREKKPQDKARSDAISYALAQRAYWLHEQPAHPDDPPSPKDPSIEFELWNDAINMTRADEWEGLKITFKRIARLAFEHSIHIEPWKIIDGNKKEAEAARARGFAFLNLAASI
ncbi:MAG: hypothetical protein Q7R51_01925 [bacterium]|nr:hypothetical protein [bacterium]